MARDDDDVEEGGRVDDWQTYRRYILAALREIKEAQKESRELIHALELETNSIKGRVAIMSAAGGGLITAAIEVALYFIRHN